MQLALDHVFILVEPEGQVADQLVELGLRESFSRDHPGQGTSNRRFEFSNCLLEFLWLRDTAEADSGPARKLAFSERSTNTDASPFGIILNSGIGAEGEMPFGGWTYQPDYFEAPNAFHIGSNSGNLSEPLCIYAPFKLPEKKVSLDTNINPVSLCKITTTARPFSEVLDRVSSVESLSIASSDSHVMELYLDNGRTSLAKDFRPDIPLVIYW